MPTSPISRYQQNQIADQLKTSRIFILEGPANNNKFEFIKSTLLDLKFDFHSLQESDISTTQKNEGTWKEWIETHWDKPHLVIHRAELVKDLEELIEYALSNENSPSIICVCDFKPTLNEILHQALTENGCYLQMYPNSFYEIAQHQGMGTLEKQLEDRLIYGAYSDILETTEGTEERLNAFIDEILTKKLSATERVNKKENLKKVLQVFAFEMGNMISFNEVAMRTDLDNETVERYVRIFEKAFILKMVPCYYDGNKYEMKKGNSVFFIDNGIRNALINNFNPMDWRQDASQLWRNWLFIEKMKWNNLLNRESEMFTWRTHTTQRIDFLEIHKGQMRGYQCSWSKKKSPRFPASFGKYYPDAKQQVLNRSTYWTFLSSKK